MTEKNFFAVRIDFEHQRLTFYASPNFHYWRANASSGRMS
jgi:hypothetical protein